MTSDEAREEPGAGAGRRAKWLRRGAAAVGLLVLAVVQLDGLWLSALAQWMLASLVLGGLARLVLGYRRRLDCRVLAAPRSPGLGRRRTQWVLRSAFWMTAGIALAISSPAAGLPPRDHVFLQGFWMAVAVLLALMEGVQYRTIHLSGNVLYGVALVLLLVELSHVARDPAPQVALAPPFHGRWIVVNGGNSTLINHHRGISAQAHAVDLVMDRVPGPAEDKLESYAAWGQPLLAPAAGRIVKVEDSQPDQPIGESDTGNPVGNHVVLEMAPERYVLLAHLQKGSAQVKVGDRVQPGKPVGRCGNSGNTSEPHLHLQVQNRAEFTAPDLHTFPIGWQDADLRRGAQPLAQGAFLRRNDRIDAGEAP